MKVESVFLWAWRSALLLLLVFIGHQLQEVRTAMRTSDTSMSVWQMTLDLQAIRKALAPEK